MKDRTATLPDDKPFDYTDGKVGIQTIMARISYKFGHDPEPPPLK